MENQSNTEFDKIINANSIIFYITRREEQKGFPLSTSEPISKLYTSWLAERRNGSETPVFFFVPPNPKFFFLYQKVHNLCSISMLNESIAQMTHLFFPNYFTTDA